jgi:hypothetical protein
MRSVLLSFAAALPLSAAAADDAQVKALEQRLTALEDRLAASEATVAAQKEQLANARLPQVGQAPSGLDKFLSTLQIGGAVTASYAYNFNNPDTNTPSQLGGNSLYQFNTDHNSFSLDAVKLELGRPASEAGSAGFQIDLLFGENANILGSGTPVATGRFYNSSSTSNRGPADGEVFVQEAYAAYNYNGTELRLGKWETLLGYEVLDSRLNPHVTQGLLFTWAIPLYHTGLLASGSLGEGMVWAAGLANGFNNSNDYGDNKGFLGRIGFSQEGGSITLNTFIGSERTRISTTGGGATIGDDNNPMQIYDLVATLTPSDQLTLWAQIDYAFEELDSSTLVGTFPSNAAVFPGPTVEEDMQWFGIALGGKFAINEKTTFSARGEWFQDDGGSRLAAAFPGALSAGNADEIDVYSATLTLARALTENLMARVEYRRDILDAEGGEAGAGFAEANADFEDTQDVGIVEVTYSFD